MLFIFAETEKDLYWSLEVIDSVEPVFMQRYLKTRSFSGIISLKNLLGKKSFKILFY